MCILRHFNIIPNRAEGNGNSLFNSISQSIASVSGVSRSDLISHQYINGLLQLLLCTFSEYSSSIPEIRPNIPDELNSGFAFARGDDDMIRCSGYPSELDMWNLAMLLNKNIMIFKNVPAPETMLFYCVEFYPGSEIVEPHNTMYVLSRSDLFECLVPKKPLGPMSYMTI